MPNYKLEREEDTKESADIMGAPHDYERIIHVPVNQEILDELNVEDKATLTLKGEVVGMEKKDSEGYSKKCIEFKITDVEAYTDNSKSADEKADKELAEGFKKASGDSKY